MIASYVVDCRVTFKHLGCIRLMGDVQTTPIWDLVRLGKGVVQTWCIFYGHCWVVVHNATYNDTLFLEKNRVVALLGCYSKAPYEQRQWRTCFIFLGMRCTSCSTYSDSYSAQGKISVIFQNNVTSFWHPIYMSLCL